MLAYPVCLWRIHPHPFLSSHRHLSVHCQWCPEQGLLERRGSGLVRQRHPLPTMSGTSEASHGPSPWASRWATPKPGHFRCHRGRKCSVKQIFPPLYILTVFPSSSGMHISEETNAQLKKYYFNGTTCLEEIHFLLSTNSINNIFRQINLSIHENYM